MSSIRNQEELDAEENDGGRYDDAKNRGPFLTGLTDETKKKKPHLYSMGILNKCVDSIDSHFKQVLVTHENDFMSAYQVS